MPTTDGEVIAFLLYAAFFRVSVVAAGVTSIVLGYQLFSKRVVAGAASLNQGEIGAKIGSAGLTIRNTAPGTAFALFGASLIVAMIVQGMPQLDHDTKRSDGGELQSEDRVVLRGDDPLSLADKGLAAERQKDTEGAVASYRQALTALSMPINNLAWLYSERGEGDKALPLARVAVQLRSDNAAYLDTLATILDRGGQRQEALKLMREAARLDPRYQAKVKLLEGS